MKELNQFELENVAGGNDLAYRSCYRRWCSWSLELGRWLV